MSFGESQNPKASARQTLHLRLPNGKGSPFQLHNPALLPFLIGVDVVTHTPNAFKGPFGQDVQGGREGGIEGGMVTVDDRHSFQDAVERELGQKGGGGRGEGRVLLGKASLACKNGEGNFL